MYVLRGQSSKLGSWERDSNLGNFGDTVTGVADAVARTAIGITGFITKDKTARAGFRAQRDITRTTQTESTRRALASGKYATEQARINVQTVGVQYGGIAKIILFSGIALTALMIAGGVAVGMASKGKGNA
jgi:hypothetical protein